MERRNPITGNLHAEGEGAEEIERETAFVRDAYKDLRRNWATLSAAQRQDALRRGLLAVLSLLDDSYT